jgi:hypothetical protein
MLGGSIDHCVRIDLMYRFDLDLPTPDLDSAPRFRSVCVVGGVSRDDNHDWPETEQKAILAFAGHLSSSTIST